MAARTIWLRQPLLEPVSILVALASIDGAPPAQGTSVSDVAPLRSEFMANRAAQFPALAHQ